MTEKDKMFLEKLRMLMDSKDLRVELRPGNPSSMILRGTYGQKIHETFGTTRQGVRWRFQHLFGQAYVRAFETIVFIEATFGTELRDYAIRISKERYALRQKAAQPDFRNGGDTKKPR
jgi:hypothetical protein